MKFRKKDLRAQIFVVLFLLSIGASLYSWTTPFRIDDYTHSETNTWSAITVDKYNRSHVVWCSDSIDNNDGNIYYRYNTEPNNYTTWSEKVNLTQNSIPYSMKPDIAIDWEGRPHIVWMTWYSTDIWWAYCDSVWKVPMNISNTPSGSQHPRLASDTLNKKLYLVWDDTFYGNFEILIKVFEGDTWGETQRVTYEPGNLTRPDIAVDSKGYLHLVWRDALNAEIHYSEFDGDTWSTPVNISNLSGQSTEPAIATDTLDRPNVVWEEREGGYKIFYTRRDNSSWFAPLHLSAPEGARPRIEIGTGNRICVIWTWYGGEFYRFYENGIWGMVGKIDSVIGWGDISVDGDNVFHVAYARAVVPWCYVYYSRDRILGIEENMQPSISSKFTLYQNYPNPFTDFTKILFTLKKSCKVSVRITDLSGRVVYKENFGRKSKGKHFFNFSNKRDNLPSGIYFYNLCVDGEIITGKMTYLSLTKK